MNVRKFTADNITAALAQVKKELGDDAVILRTRQVKKSGLLPFAANEVVEVTAASPDRNPPPPDLPDNESTNEVKRLLSTAVSSHSTLERPRDDLRSQISELKSDIKTLTEQINSGRVPSLPPVLAKRYEAMVHNGVESRIAGKITESINLHHPGEALDDENFIDRKLVESVAGMLKVRQLPLKSEGSARVIAVIGPTGVGKTTTLAKLVTSYRFWGRQNCALVSADTYRVAALEQLKTFAAIAGLPMETAYQPAAMKPALERHMQRDAIFIDTAGRSQIDREKIEELGDFLAFAQPHETLLCLTVSTRIEDQLDIIERYSYLKPTGIIFTKLDETRQPGAILSVTTQSSVPLICMTFGQNVPDDISSINPDKVAEAILKPGIFEDLLNNRFSDWITKPTLNGTAT